MTATAGILTEVDEGVAVVTFNNPERLNSITNPVAGELAATLRSYRTDDEVRAIVLTGAGNKAFCTGSQLGAVKLPPNRTRLKTSLSNFGDVTRAIVAVDKPVIAAISGFAVGAGFSFALAADHRIADPSAKLSGIWVKRGIAPDCGATYFLPRIVGHSRALHMLITGAMVGAEEAYRIGLVDEVTEPGKALERAVAYAKELAKGAAVVIDLVRRGVYRSWGCSLEDMLDYEAWITAVSHKTFDRPEGTSAFLERREPNFRGE